jgi:hypothetical protein
MPENTQDNTTPAFDFDVEVPKVTLGTAVEYVGTKGKIKLGLVVGTPETVEEGTALPALLPGQLHIAVFTWSVGTFVPRLNVPFEGLVSGNTEFQEDGKAVGVWRIA